MRGPVIPSFYHETAPAWDVDGDQVSLRSAGQHGGMLTMEDCIGLCGLTEEEVLAIAAHERIPGMAAAELGNYLVNAPDGEMCIKAMIRDDIAHEVACANRDRELALRLVLRNFVLQHPRCEERHLEQLRLPERRLADRG